MARREQALNVKVSDLEGVILANLITQSSDSVITSVNDQRFAERRNKFLISTYEFRVQSIFQPYTKRICHLRDPNDDESSTLFST